jgi:hypothetical protein
LKFSSFLENALVNRVKRRRVAVNAGNSFDRMNATALAKHPDRSGLFLNA